MSLLAEQNVIGALLMEPGAVERVKSFLRPDMFSGDLYGRVYLEFLRAYDNHYHMDIPVLLTKIKDNSLTEAIITREINTCAIAVYTSATIVAHAQLIYDAYKANQLNQILQTTLPEPTMIDTQIGSLINDLEALKDNEKTTAKNMKMIVAENRDSYFVDREDKKIYLGFPETDNRLGGLEGGDVIIIGARPAVGKSAFVTQIALNFTKQGKRVGFYNLEMQDNQMYERFIVRESGIGLTRLKRAKSFLGDEKERFDKANETLTKQNLMLSTGIKSVSEIRAEVKNMNYDLLIIDYLQLLKSDVNYRNRIAEVGAISKAIKAIAMDYNIPVIVLSQLNRTSEGRETREPSMSELREAGDIEQDASVILLMWNLDEGRRNKGLKVDKNRQGEFGISYLKFDGNLMCFEETAKPEFRRVSEKTPFD